VVTAAAAVPRGHHAAHAAGPWLDPVVWTVVLLAAVLLPAALAVLGHPLPSHRSRS
jgi:hypothetical protein